MNPSLRAVVPAVVRPTYRPFPVMYSHLRRVASGGERRLYILTRGNTPTPYDEYSTHDLNGHYAGHHLSRRAIVTGEAEAIVVNGVSRSETALAEGTSTVAKCGVPCSTRSHVA